MNSSKLKTSLALLSLVIAGELSYDVGLIWDNYRAAKTTVTSTEARTENFSPLEKMPQSQMYDTWQERDKILPGPYDQPQDNNLMKAPYRVIKLAPDKINEFRT
ncbi:MAG: hypothetical protein WC796_00235 [Candidatus Pacearchaeota archaeon]|jgi:hypothetical protein